MMLDRPAIARAVISAIADVFGVADPAAITESTVAADVDGWDSLSHTMLLMKLETVLGRQLPLAKMFAAANVGELVDAAAPASVA